jgi:hypothetical protein
VARADRSTHRLYLPRTLESGRARRDLTSGRCPPAANEMHHDAEDGEDEQNMDRPRSDVKHPETAYPKDSQNHRKQ